ncbi:multiple sugar transport system substrate-binding protein [Thermocatellispora tengchongensis]|uniref:Multiple sugar transport system substrate-binding protein n=1 Tax=Thermocatellispora tengchongensis TaxID=1073253 RepID=A0A840PEJ5_9ACTN|nr:extracellular solute-binding protein [Thermocatellispora tengchongensis]MBB5137399.1 multiple sugar transport system substrate-binding protein [Thermocatellispora tengchongensis]
MALVTAAAMVLAGCGGSDPGGKPDGPVKIKVWAWYPAFQPVVDLFNKTHTDVQIEWTNAGTGQDQYTKLQTALKAGKGAPDVVMLEFQEIPTFQLTKHLVDMGKYGANDIKGNYVDWAWKQVSNGDEVYAIPVDAGPMAMLYRKDIFDKYGLTVPKTWAEFKEQAQKLKAASPTSFMTDFGANDGGFMTGLLWQAGARPFTYKAAQAPNIGVDVNSEPAKKVMAYWEDMVDSGLADTAAFATTDFYNGLSTGKYATYLAAGWGPGYLSSVAKETSGKWRAAPLPQWNPGENAQGDWGGSAFAVTDQTKHPREATKVAMEIFGVNKDAWKIGIDQAFLFPTATPILEWDAFREKKYDFFGGQKVNEVFVPAYNGIGEFEWSPFNSYYFSQLTTALNQAVEKKSSWPAALDTVQQNLSTYASQQGFKVAP